MRKMKIALAVLKQDDDYLLQRRGDIPKIGAAGLIGLFGGKIEDEKAVEAACREVDEETNLNLKPNDAKYLGEVDVTSDHNLEHVVVNAQIYSFDIDKKLKVEAKDGELVRLTREQASQQLDKMTPSTAATFRQLLGED